MGDLIVKYNNQTLSPTPLVSYSEQFVDYGTRWGNVTQIELNGFLTGLNTTGDIRTLTNIFTGQFGGLSVSEQGGNNIYNWSNVYVENISFSNNPFYRGAFAPYSVKLHTNTVPSGVLEPTNEYAFTQNTDSTVSVSHKISARGVKNSTDAMTNAVNFVRSFTGKNPFNNCAPAFIPNGSGILMSLTENLDRTNASITVTEQYRFTTGSTLPYVETTTLTINDATESDFVTLDLNMKLQGSPIYGNIGQVDSAVSNISMFGKIASFGLTTGFMMPNSFNLTRDTGACSVDIRSSYFSGYSASDINGYFDYDVGVQSDLLLPGENWSIEGEFVCRGPLEYRISRINNFKTTNGSDWRSYLSGLILSSPLYTNFHNASIKLSPNTNVSIRENPNQGQFYISMQMVDGYEPTGLSNTKFSIEVEPSRWQYELLPSANIEGHYILQDLQVRSQSKVQFNLSTQANNASYAAATLSGYADALATVYIDSGFLISDTLNTGVSETTITKQWIGRDKMNSGLLYSKSAGSITNNSLRAAGFKFGY